MLATPSTLQAAPYFFPQLAPASHRPSGPISTLPADPTVNVLEALDSPLHASVVHITTCLNRAVEAHLTVSRSFGTATSVAVHHTDYANLERPVPRSARTYPVHRHSLLNAYAKRRPAEGCHLLSDLSKPWVRQPDRRFHEFGELDVDHALALVSHHGKRRWTVFVFFRKRGPHRFAHEHHLTLKRLAPSVGARLADASAREPRQAGKILTPTAESTSASPSSAAQLMSMLTKTEKQVAVKLRARLTEEQIADELNRSVHTVHTHVRNIYRKLDIHSRPEFRRAFGAVD